MMLKEQYECPHFHILIIGRANAGKTTILEKMCGVQQGTKPIIYKDGKLNEMVNPAAFSYSPCCR
jgi:ABC-type cobalamin/Fe3+-siderophores transport system ATPase subunit